MSSNESSSTSFGGGFCGLLTILFIGLRLTGYIDWPWWAVLAPMWGPYAATAAVALFLIVLGAIVDALGAIVYTLK